MTVSFNTADKPREIVYNNSVIKKLARKIHHVSGYVNEIPDFTRPFDLNQIMTIIKAHCLFAHYPTLSIQGHRLSLLSDPVRRSQVGRPLRVWSNCCFSSFISITALVVDQTRRCLVFDVLNLPRIQKMKWFMKWHNQLYLKVDFTWMQRTRTICYLANLVLLINRFFSFDINLVSGLYIVYLNEQMHVRFHGNLFNVYAHSWTRTRVRGRSTVLSRCILIKFDSR